MKRKLAKWVIWYMVTVMGVIGMTPRLYAGLSPSEVIALSQSDRHSDLQKIQKILESKMIRERLKQLGFSEEGIQKRLSQLSDQQIHQIASKVDELDVGGDGLEVVIALLVIIILAVIIYYLLGHKIEIRKNLSSSRLNLIHRLGSPLSLLSPSLKMATVGGHYILMIGLPVAGKTMLPKGIPNILI